MPQNLRFFLRLFEFVMHLVKKAAKIIILPTTAFLVSGVFYKTLSSKESEDKMPGKLFIRQEFGNSRHIPSLWKKPKSKGAKFKSEITFEDFLNSLTSEAKDENRDYFIQLLKEEAGKFDSFYFECPPVSQNTKSKPFEFVLLPSKTLHTRQANPSAFEEHFTKSQTTVAFESLGKDAKLIAPCPKHEDDPSIYGHAAIFMKEATQEQVKDLWKTVGEEMKKRLNNSPNKIWLSTAGDGISWLHVRLDSRPKYYNHQEYQEYI